MAMPAIRRTAKQLVYAITAIGLVVVVVGFFVLPRINIFGRGDDPAPDTREQIVIESVDSVRHGNTFDIIARVRNPNPRVGVPEYTVTFVLLDANNNEIDRLPQETYLLPGSLNYVAALDVPVTANLARVQVATPAEATFALTPKAVSEPTFNSFLRGRTARTFGNSRFEIQKGIVVNTSTLGFFEVDVTGVAFDTAGKVVGVGKTFIGNFQSGEQREFTLQWPAPSTPTERVIIIPATNIYHASNILPTIGNPDHLRQPAPPIDPQANF